ncbi:MAG: hypothetical protein OEV66_03060, partial [Spirochaetia bacterium]|nr:hypothetical protein [Spirochaetia bacterium]
MSLDSNQAGSLDVKSEIALVAVTRNGGKLGIEIARKLHSKNISLDLYFQKKFQTELQAVSKGDVNLLFYPEKIKNLLQDILDKYRNFIFIVSIGALIRIIAPFLKGKD